MIDRTNKETAQSQENLAEKLSAASAIDAIVGRTNSNLLVIDYLLNEKSEISADLNKILENVINAGPSNFKRILDYLIQLNQNIRETRNADPRAYAREVFRSSDESA
nr:hypothetical protein [Nitrosomonas nitrosa]